MVSLFFGALDAVSYLLAHFSMLPGFHEKRVDEILAYWKTHPEFERQVSGVACLQALKDRKKPFILCEKKFDCRGERYTRP